MSAPIDPSQRTIWSSGLIAVTLGAISLIVLAAFESLAVTTVMPVVSEELNGEALYALAFAGTMAAGIIGMIAIGTWCDAKGPLWPLTTAVTLFVIGLIVAGVAETMPMLVLGRLIQGLGAGGQTVALYVIVARMYPPSLNGRIFAAFATAWVVPSLVGPFVAGAVADYVHWRWVFLGVAILVVVAYILIFPKLRSLDAGPNQPIPRGTLVRFLLAVVVASLAMIIGLVSQLETPLNIAVAVGAIVIMLVAVRPLLPAGTLRLRRGLPSVIVQRGLIAASLFGAEVYLPYLLRDVYGYSPMFSGLALTGSAVLWATASNIQGRYGDRLGNRRTALIGTTVLVSSIALTSLLVFAHAPAWTLIVVWAFAGGGIGLMFPRTTVLTLAYSTPKNQGFNSSALSISESLAAASTIAVLGIVLSILGATTFGFGVVIACAGIVGLASYVPGLRLGHAAETPRTHSAQ